MDIPEILPFSPNRVWRTYLGGRTLDGMDGKNAPEDTHFPEDWIGSTTVAVNPGESGANDGLAMVSVGGKTVFLRELLKQCGRELLGEAHMSTYGTDVRFLLKFLDSAIRLHIQCHPDIGFARKRLSVNSGKTEAYVILKIREEVSDPFIYFGFQKEVRREDFKKAVLTQDGAAILAPFDRIPVKEGDIFIVPGGLPHAIGAGIFMVEIMEPSDLTVRFEFEREGITLPESARFMNKGIDFALDMVDFNTYSLDDLRRRFFATDFKRRELSEGSWEEVLIDTAYTDCFRAKRWCIHDRVTVSEAGFYYAIVLKGRGTLSAGDTHLSVNEYDRFMVPRSTESLSIHPEESLEILTVYPPTP
jgi:mannose-6-phosphate isomerase